MATREIAIAAGATPSAIAMRRNYSRPMGRCHNVIFHVWFLTCLNEILVPHLKAIFDLSYAQVMLTPVLGVKK